VVTSKRPPHRRLERPTPITYKIDLERKLVVTRIWGAATEDEVAEHNRSLRVDPQFDPHFRQLADMSGVTELLVSTKVIRDTAHDQYFAPGSRRAFVASDDAAFGLARMFALHAEGMGQTIHVFRDRAAAEKWLGL
jgi:hypothetical protein